MFGLYVFFFYFTILQLDPVVDFKWAMVHGGLFRPLFGRGDTVVLSHHSICNICIQFYPLKNTTTYYILRFNHIFIVFFNHFRWYDSSWVFSLHPSWPPGLKLPVSQDINLPPACDSHLPYQVGRRYKRRWPLPRNSPSRADRGGGAGRHTCHVCTRLQHQKQAVHFRMWKNMTRVANVNTNPGEFIRIVSQ